ncbi:MAG: tetratricopeptide repeat protein [Planctomycetes bacterium]|nr:tetratricopeptide repeat protein [Planctomycetota bacterium]
MADELNFSLPEKKRKYSFTSGIIIILLLILVGQGAVNFLIRPSNQGPYSANTVSALSPEQVKQLASRLAGRNLYTRAAKVWRDYLVLNKLPDKEHARILFQIGTLFEKAGSYAEAIEYYYRSEAIAKIGELEPQINAHIKNCFERLGKFSALRYELMDRTSFKKTKNAGGKIVAEIGAEKITEADLGALIEAAIENQLAPMAAFMTTDQLYEQKNKILEQYNDPSAKQQFLQSWLAQEVLYRQGLKEDLMQKPETKKLIEELTRSLLSQQLMNAELAGKINITETDLQTYYQANKGKFIEPANKEDPNSTERQKSFDEVRDQVTSELVGRKSQDVQQSFIKQLMDKYNVIIHSSALMPTEQSKDDK